MKEIWQKSISVAALMGLVVGLVSWDMDSGLIAGFGLGMCFCALFAIGHALQVREAEKICRKHKLSELDIRLLGNVPIDLNRRQKLELSDELRKRK